MEIYLLNQIIVLEEYQEFQLQHRVALENSNAQSQLGSSIASVFGSLTLTQGDFTKDKTKLSLLVYLMLILKLVLKEKQ
jgi:hypothetical protein